MDSVSSPGTGVAEDSVQGRCVACGSEAGSPHPVYSAHSFFVPPPYGPLTEAVPDADYCIPCLNALANRLYLDVSGSFPSRCHRCRIDFKVGMIAMQPPGMPGYRECEECFDDVWTGAPSGQSPQWRQDRERGYRLRLRLSDLRDQQEALDRKLQAVKELDHDADTPYSAIGRCKGCRTRCAFVKDLSRVLHDCDAVHPGAIVPAGKVAERIGFYAESTLWRNLQRHTLPNWTQLQKLWLSHGCTALGIVCEKCME